MQKFAIAIGLLLSLLFLTGSNVNAETTEPASQMHRTRSIIYAASRTQPTLITSEPAENVRNR